MVVLVTFFLFLIGLFWGSFLLVVASRIPRGESLNGRSHCEYCKHVLGMFDLVPIFSFLFLRGKCRYCQKKMGWEYPISEFLTGLVFILPVILGNFELGNITNGSILQVSFYFFILSVLIVIFFADLKYYIIPFSILLPAIAVVLMWTILIKPEYFITYLLSALGAFLFFLFIFLLTKGRGMGFGDVVYAFFMGLLLGYPSIVVGLYIAFLTGAVVSIILIVLRRKKLKGGIVPFGPFLILGTYVALFWGDKIWRIIWGYL